MSGILTPKKPSVFLPALVTRKNLKNMIKKIKNTVIKTPWFLRRLLMEIINMVEAGKVTSISVNTLVSLGNT